MTKAADLDYELHHLCIYDDKPRDNMWPYLRWHHAITNYFSGEVFHVTGEGHSDYTFLAAGGPAFQIQIEAPPFQFEYERNWWRDHGRGYNHICWIVNDARKSHDQLLADGAELVMPFEQFPTYDGFVVKDPEGRWVEIMEYTDPLFRVNELAHAPSGECGLEMIGTAEIVEDMEAMIDWYGKAMDMRVIKEFRDGDDAVVYMSDKYYDPKERNSLFVLQTARHDWEKKHKQEHGPQIASITYQAANVERAFEDAKWAGFEVLAEPENDPLTGALTAHLAEANGNHILLREPFMPYRKVARHVQP